MATRFQSLLFKLFNLLNTCESFELFFFKNKTFKKKIQISKKSKIAKKHKQQKT